MTYHYTLIWGHTVDITKLICHFCNETTMGLRPVGDFKEGDEFGITKLTLLFCKQES